MFLRAPNIKWSIIHPILKQSLKNRGRWHYKINIWEKNDEEAFIRTFQGVFGVFTGVNGDKHDASTHIDLSELTPTEGKLIKDAHTADDGRAVRGNSAWFARGTLANIMQGEGRDCLHESKALTQGIPCKLTMQDMNLHISLSFGDS